MQYLVEKVELSDDKEQLIFHTRSVSDCRRLWSQLYGQSIDYTEGHKPIPFDIIEDFPNDTKLDILIDTNQILNVLNYLEVELKFHEFLAPGTAEQFRKQLESGEKPLAPARRDAEPHDEPHDEPVDDRKYSPK